METNLNDLITRAPYLKSILEGMVGKYKEDGEKYEITLETKAWFCKSGNFVFFDFGEFEKRLPL